MSNELIEHELTNKKRKLDKTVYKSGDIVLLDESRYFGYEIENIKNEGGIFSNDYYVFTCCGKNIKRWVGRRDFATLLDHLKESHNAICIKCTTDEPKLSRIMVEYTVKCVL